MSNVGLLFVGAALFVNGLSLIGLVQARGTAPLNIFVGALQVVLPTIGLIQSHTPADIASWAPVYLFGFTYLYVGINGFAGLDGQGLGWYSLFVAAVAVVHGVLSIKGDLAFAAIWFLWALMWLMFWLVLGVGRTEFTTFTGWLLILGAHLTCTGPALLGLQGAWPTSRTFGVMACLIAVVVTAAAALLSRAARTAAPAAAL